MGRLLALGGLGISAVVQPVTLGVAVGLLAGKLFGVFSAVWLMVKAGWADRPAAASWGQVLGVALLCGIGFTMSLFVSLLAFQDVVVQDEAKLGILLGSMLAGVAGYMVLVMSQRRGVYRLIARK